MLVVLLVISSCQDMGVDIEGPGKIRPGVGVEGIRLGDSRETVVAILGPPTTVGDVIGFYRGWRHYSYLEGGRISQGGELSLTFAFIENGIDYGPVDLIIGGPAYRGKTREGIGIGSFLTEVHTAYGTPEAVQYWSDQNTIADVYCMNNRKFEIHYTDSVVSGFSIGYFIPMPENPDDPCR